MKTKKLIVIFVFLFIMPGISSAAPNVSDISGTVSHGQNITVSGSGFGAKNPAAPELWDDGEGTHSVISRWTDYEPKASTCTNDISIMQYRINSFRSVSNPHSRGSRFLGGAADYNPDRSVEVNTNVGVHHLFGSAPSVAYLHYYETLDPNYPREDSSTHSHNPYLTHNHKEIDWGSNNNGTMYGGRVSGTTHYNFMLGGGAPDSAAATNLGYTINDTTAGDQTRCYNNPEYCLAASDIIGVWGAWEHVIDFDGIYSITFNHQPIAYDDDINFNDELPVDSISIGGYACHQWPVTTLASWTGPDANNEYFATLASETKHLFRGLTSTPDRDLPKGTVGILAAGQWGYANGRAYVKNDPVGVTHYATNSACGTAGGGYGHTGHNDAFRYYDDIYIDTTWSRLILANNSKLDQTTIMEPQIPSAWQDGSVTVTANLGKLSDSGTAYLFVFDANNEHNATGYPVTIGGGGGDVASPAVPGGLSIR